MAKQTGLGDAFYIEGVDLSGDTASLSAIVGGPELLELTGINKSAIERGGGLKSGALEFTSWFNPAAAQQHATLSPLPTADVVACYFRGTTVGNAAAGMTAKQLNYDATRGTDGSLTVDVEMLSNGFGLDWGYMLTAGIQTDSGATNGTSIDLVDVSTDFGIQAYLQVFSFTGTDATITVQDSANDSTFAAVSAFTEVTSGPTVERLASSRTENVRRYLRVATSTSAGFSDLQFAVCVTRNLTDVQL